MADTSQDAPKNVGGRPLKFETVEDLDAAIDAYLGDCAPHIVKTKVRMTKVDGTAYWAEDEVFSEQKPLSVSGAAFAMGTNRQTLLDYKERAEYTDSIRRLLAACEAYTESMLYTNAANGASSVLSTTLRAATGHGPTSKS